MKTVTKQRNHTAKIQLTRGKEVGIPQEDECNKRTGEAGSKPTGRNFENRERYINFINRQDAKYQASQALDYSARFAIARFAMRRSNKELQRNLLSQSSRTIATHLFFSSNNCYASEKESRVPDVQLESRTTTLNRDALVSTNEQPRDNRKLFAIR